MGGTEDTGALLRRGVDSLPAPRLIPSRSQSARRPVPGSSGVRRVSSGSLSARQAGTGWRASGSDDFDYQPLVIDAGVSRADAATMLALRAEFSGWELARVLRFPDGSRRVWLRRRRTSALLPDLKP